MIKEVPAGTPVSYGGTYVTDKPTKIATIPVGYGDGYPRSLSNKGYVLINGHHANIIGRVCMDQFMVDVTDIHYVLEGDEVVLLGRDKNTGEEILEFYSPIIWMVILKLSKRSMFSTQKPKSVLGRLKYYFPTNTLGILLLKSQVSS